MASRSRSRFRPANIGLKATALFLALLVYGSVYLDQDQESVIRMPLVIENPYLDRMLVGAAPPDVEARVVAPGRLLARWWLTGTLSDLHAVIEVPPAGGTIDRSIGPEDVMVPLGIDLRVLEIVSPLRVQLQLDQVTERIVPVRPLRIGQPPQGYILSGPITVRPESVLVRGPQETVDALTEAQTVALDLSGRTRPIHETALITRPEGLTFSPSEVNVSADIETTEQLPVDRVPVRVLNGRQYEVTVEPEVGSVVLMGPKSQLDVIERRESNGEESGLVITVDVAGMGPGVHSIGPNVSLTDDIRLIGVSPPVIQVTLADSDADSF